MKDILNEIDKLYQGSLSSIKELTDVIGNIKNMAMNLESRVSAIEKDMAALKVEMEHWEEHTDIDGCIYNKLDLLTARYSELDKILNLMEG